MVVQKETMDVLLAESFKELACRQPIEKITIKAVTDKAGVIRPTFYNHFQDKYELLEWIIQVQILEPIRPLIHAGMVDEALILIFTLLKKEKEFYEMAVRLEGQNSFEDIVKKCVEGILMDTCQFIPRNMSAFHLQFLDFFRRCRSGRTRIMTMVDFTP